MSKQPNDKDGAQVKVKNETTKGAAASSTPTPGPSGEVTTTLTKAQEPTKKEKEKPKKKSEFELEDEEEWEEVVIDCPLYSYHIIILKFFGILSCFLFFPTGIPAAYYAFKTGTEYNKGIEIDDLFEAKKYSIRTGRLIIFSGFFSIFAVLIIMGSVNKQTADSVFQAGTIPPNLFPTPPNLF